MDTLQQAESTAAQLAPLAGLISPQAATVAALAPIAIDMLNSAVKLTQAGAMTQDQLAGLFQTIGQGIQSTHAQWTALNKT